MKLLLAGLVAAALFGAAPASADPDCGFHDPRLCDPSKMYFCPDSGQFVTWLQYCPALVLGPRLPGSPPEGGDDR